MRKLYIILLVIFFSLVIGGSFALSAIQAAQQKNLGEAISVLPPVKQSGNNIIPRISGSVIGDSSTNAQFGRATTTTLCFSGTGTCQTSPGGGTGLGTVTSVGMVVPTGLSVATVGGTGAATSTITWLAGYQPYTSYASSTLENLKNTQFTEAIASTTFQPIILSGTYDPYGQATSSINALTFNYPLSRATNAISIVATSSMAINTDDLIQGATNKFMTYPGSGIALSSGSAWSASITNNSTNWNTAYGWGNHAVAGYLTSYDAFTHPAAGQSATTSLMLLNGNATTTGLTVSGSTYLATTAGNNVGIGSTSPYSLFSVQATAGGSTPLFTIASSTNGAATSTAFTVLANGNVRVGLGTGLVGTLLPNEKFNVYGEANTAVASFYAPLTNSDYSIIRLGTGTVSSANLKYIYNSTVSQQYMGFGFSSGSSDVFGYLGNGNVGIGTTTPYAMLSVAGQIVGQNFVATSTTATSTFAGGMNVAGTAGLTVLQNGFVGMGTANPITSLTVSTGSGLISGSFIQTGAGTTEGAGMVGYADNGAAMLSGNRLGYFAFGGAQDASHTLTRPALMEAFATENWSSTNKGTRIVFEGTPTGSATRVEWMTLKNGNVGIGTTTPWKLLSLQAVTGGEIAIKNTTSGRYTLLGMPDSYNADLDSVGGGNLRLKIGGVAQLTLNGTVNSFSTPLGIATTSPGSPYKLDVYGQARIDGTDTATSTIRGNILFTGQTQITGCYFVYGATAGATTTIDCY